MHAQLPAVAHPQAATRAVKPSNKNDALALYARKDYEGARKLLSRKVQANPGDAESYYYLGNCYLRLRNYRAALAEYKRANELAGDCNIGAYSRSAITQINNIMHPPLSAAANAAAARAAKSASSAGASAGAGDGTGAAAGAGGNGGTSAGTNSGTESNSK